MTSLVLLEDENSLREEIAAFLVAGGYIVAQAGTVAEFNRLIGAEKFDIAVIDVGLPDGDGFQVSTALRGRQPGIGIVMLTARGGTDDKLQGLQGGADHYLVKPIKLAELAAYIAALARRLPCGWRLVAHRKMLYAPDGRGIQLSSQELILMTLLAQHAGETVARRSIVAAFGADWLSYDLRRLDTLVSRLRRRWKSELGIELPVRTEHGEGYCFVAEIESR